ncbi:MAG: dihydrolipoyllysine-residue acetyltransferase [Rhodocyclaceae bacterium]|nr:dihydrolipoyllysine-residue acetyltransferase [Rhodocyclaceae bacterium]MBP6280111.1 dihydrolipoyllysine-residue acetyltransferase [Rhodocyclaceae bacterium]
MANLVEVKVPDIGDFKGIPVIEVLVAVGDVVKVDDSLVTLESDKATMDVPSSSAGVVTELRMKVGDLVSEGSVVAVVDMAAASAAAGAAVGAGDTPPPLKATSPPAAPQQAAPTPTLAAPPPAQTPVSSSAMAMNEGMVPAPTELHGAPPRIHMPSPGELAAEVLGGSMSHASPSVRRFARELGVDVSRVTGSGPKNRILQEDVQAYVKGVMSGSVSNGVSSAPTTTASGGELNLLPWPKVDFTKFGVVEAKPLSRIKKISGANLHRNWVMIPHVTQFDEADITDLEAFRQAMNKENEKSGVKLTMLAFLIKASVAALKKFPDFNASLDGENLIYKQYFNIGFAADTPNGLVVPVIKNADQKGVGAIATEMGELAKKARDGKLGPAEMSGGCFSISSLGGIGGTAFTPIINAPEVAILGVSKTQTKAVWDGKQFVPRQMLPMSLSYDHRVIDGASAARFTSYLGALLSDMRRVML